MVLSGGNKGTVSSSSGSLSVYNHRGGALIFYATYSGGMHGHYSISGSHMYLTYFTAGTIHVYLNNIHGHPNDQKVMKGTFHNAHIPDQVLPCTTQDALVSYFGGGS